MKKRSKLYGLVISLGLAGGGVFSLASGLSLCLYVHEETPIESGRIDLAKGDVISPLEGLNFDEGEWVAYIVLSYADFQRLRGKFARNCLKLTDREAMKRMREAWNMSYTGGDAATVGSRIVFVNNGEVVFKSGIVLTEGGLEGLQTGSFGWIEPRTERALWDAASEFKPVYWPLIIL